MQIIYNNKSHPVRIFRDLGYLKDFHLPKDIGSQVIKNQILSSEQLFLELIVASKTTSISIGYEIYTLLGEMPDNREIILKQVKHHLLRIYDTASDAKWLINAFPETQDELLNITLNQEKLTQLTEIGSYIFGISTLIKTFPKKCEDIMKIIDKILIEDYFNTKLPNNLKQYLEFKKGMVKLTTPIRKFKDQLENHCKSLLFEIEKNETLGKYSEKYQQVLISQAIVLAQTGDPSSVKHLLKNPHLNIQNSRLLSSFVIGWKTFRQFIMERNDLDLIARLQSNAILTTDKNGNTQILRSINERYLFPENVERVKILQRAISSRNSINKLHKNSALNLDQNLYDRHEIQKIQESLQDEEVKKLYGIVIKKNKNSFYKKHTVNKEADFHSIIASGRILSQNHVEQETGKESAGINTRGDHKDSAHLFSFFGQGADKKTLPTPFQLNSESKAYIIINLKRWHNTSPAQSRFHISKTRDWGNRSNYRFNIPDTNAMIEINYNDTADDHGGLSEKASQHYYYIHNGKRYDWELNILDEVATGRDYENLVPILIGRHLMRLPVEEQKVLLASIKTAGDDPQKQQAAVKALINIFYQMEGSIGGYLPLELEYVDTIKPPGINSKPISIKALRQAAENGNQTSVSSFLQAHQNLANAPWVIGGIYRIAKHHKHTELITWITPTYESIVIPSERKGLYLVPEALQQIRILQQLILEGENSEIKVDHNLESNSLLFTNKPRSKKNERQPSTAALNNLYQALGFSDYKSKDFPSTLAVPLETDQFENLESVRDALLTCEFINFINSPENYKNIKAIKETKLSITPNALSISAQCKQLESVFLTLDHPAEKDFEEAIKNIKKHISSHLNIPENKISTEESKNNSKVIHIKVPVYYVLYRLQQSNFSYQTLSEQGLESVQIFNDQLTQLSNTFISPSEINKGTKWLADNQGEAMTRFLNTHKEQVKPIINKFRKALSTMENISNRGLQAELRQHTLQNIEFRKLLQDTFSCKILIYLSALGKDTDSLTTLGLDKEICEEVECPLFSSFNSYSNTRAKAFFSGIEYSNSSDKLDEDASRSIFSDLLLNISPINLFLPNRDDEKNFDQNINHAREYVQCYIQYFKNLRKLIPLNTKSAGEQFLLEQYNPKQWNKYVKRFKYFSEIYKGFSINDGYGEKIQKVINNANGSIEDIINKGLILTPVITHFVLDPKHLQSILGGNYGEFKQTFFAIIDLLKNNHSKNTQHTITAMQIFIRLKQLEFECYKECHISKIASQEIKTKYKEYMNIYYHSNSHESDENNLEKFMRH